MHALKGSTWRSAGAGAAVIAAILAAGGTAVAARHSSAPAARAAAGCTAGGLVAWLDTDGNGAAGSVYYSLELTNLSGHSCTLAGYPGVSGVNISGSMLGTAAARAATPTPHTITLRNGASATSVLRIVDVGALSSSACRPVTAAGLRVYPPNTSSAKFVPFPFAACSRSGPVYLTVRAVTHS